MQSKMLAEPNSGATITILKQWAAQFQLAICGSYIAVSYTHLDVYKRQAEDYTPKQHGPYSSLSNARTVYVTDISFSGNVYQLYSISY